MLKLSNKGFSFVEVLVAKTILLFILAIFLPIYTTISYEHIVLKSRLLIVSSLHDHLQTMTFGEQTVNNITNTINNNQVEFSFKKEGRYIKGCANWINQRNRKEEVCLYGLDKD